MVNNCKLFTNKSEAYARCRPSYPSKAIEWLRERVQGESVADIGAGTGIFTACLLPYFKNVCAIEPNADMRKQFSDYLPGIPCFNACGEATGLPDSSIDLITVAQAFHWLDEDSFKLEAQRILRPNGLTAIIWNSSVETDFTIARDEICKKYCPRFRLGRAGKRTATEGDEFLRNTYFKTVQVIDFDNPFSMDYDSFIGNMNSRSYALLPDAPNYSAFVAELTELFKQYANNGVVVDSQKTTIYLGSF
jgi:ubiquinone/menaquinone biosynthesis C-methylase UbiE